MSTNLFAEGKISPGHHRTAELFGMTFNTDTILSTVIAAIVVLILAFVLRAKVTSTGVPSGVQLFWETITIQMRQQIESSIGMKIAPFVLPLAVTLFTYILVANWLAVLPVQYGHGEARASCSRRRPRTSTSSSRWRRGVRLVPRRGRQASAASSATRSS